MEAHKGGVFALRVGANPGIVRDRGRFPAHPSLPEHFGQHQNSPGDALLPTGHSGEKRF